MYGTVIALNDLKVRGLSRSAKTHVRGSFTCKTATRSRSMYLPVQQTSPGRSRAPWLDASPLLNICSVCSEHDGRWCRRSLFFCSTSTTGWLGSTSWPGKRSFVKTISGRLLKTAPFPVPLVPVTDKKNTIDKARSTHYLRLGTQVSLQH